MTYDEFLKKYAVKIISHQKNGNRLFFTIGDADLQEVCQFLFQELGCRLSTSTGLEVYDGFEVIHHFSDDHQGQYFCPTVKISRKNPEMNSIAMITKAASWIEREIHDLYGIVFRGHPDLRPLLKENNDVFSSGSPFMHERKNQ